MKQILFFAVLVSIVSRCWAQPGSGDVFREYKWRPVGRWQRVTGPEVTEPRALKNLPNSVNKILNWEGDGNYRQWHYRYFYNEMHSHIGTSTAATHRLAWNDAWIPTQDQSIKLMARIVDDSGMCYMTPALVDITLRRDHTVRMYKPYDVPRRWSTRAKKTHRCKVNVKDDLSKAIAAKIIMSTWNGVAADEIGINEEKVVTRVGQDHDLSYDEFEVPLNLIKPGVNTLYTHSNTTHHGIEVQWPGMVLLIKYDEPE